MSRQLFFENRSNIPRNKSGKELILLNWNIRNPSYARAVKQVETILSYSPEVIILTEVRTGKGSDYIRDRLSAYNYDCFFTAHGSDYGAFVATSIPGFALNPEHVGFLPHRAISIMGNNDSGEINILGIYVPSRGPKANKNAYKKKFQSKLSFALPRLLKGDNTIVAGDLNVLERSHMPHYPVFGEWEYKFYDAFIESGLADAFKTASPNSSDYSWFGRNGDAYRFDHAFISQSLVKNLMECRYIHEPRIAGLSDHSMMLLRLRRG